MCNCSREQPSPGFVRLTLGGPELEDFVSAGFDDHVKLILPQAGRELPALPVLLDGRPTFVEDERPTLRDYTPLRYDAARQNLIMDFALHDAGPATEWALTAPLGQWVGLAGPRGSLVISANLPWHWLFGDETAMPAIERRLAELPAGSRAVVRVQLRNPADRRQWKSTAQLDCAWVESLADAVQALELPRTTTDISGRRASTAPWPSCGACCWPRAPRPSACAWPRTGSRARQTTMKT